MEAEYAQRQTLPATPMDAGVVEALEDAAAGDRRAVHADALRRGPRHDVRRRPRPERDGLRPCKDGVSHDPAEDADPADAALAAEIMLNAIQALL